MKMKHQLNNKKRTEVKLLIFAITLLVFVLSAVMIIRLSQAKPLFPMGESYYNMQMGQALKQDFFLMNEPVQGTPYEPNPYHYLLALLLFIFPVQLVSILIPLVLGVLSGLLFFRLLKLIRVKQAAGSLIVLAVTPAFITLFTGLYLAGLVVFLSLLTLVIALHKKHVHQFLCILLLTLLALTSLTGFLLTVLILLFLFLVLKRKIRFLYVPIIIPVLVITLLTLFFNYAPRLLGFHGFAFQNILSLLQASLGFDLFLVVLFLTGFVIVWVKAKEKKLYHLIVLGLFILSFFNILARVFTSFIMTVYCVVAINYLYDRKWHLRIIRTGTLFIVLCSLVFSVSNQANMLVNAQPDKEMLGALLFLKGLDKDGVLTIEENGFLVQFYSEKKVLLDCNSFPNPGYPELKRDLDTLFRAARLKEAEPLIKEHNLHYILITPSMKEELWENRKQGLWFLVMHSESFIKKYEEEGIEIWGYRGI